MKEKLLMLNVQEARTFDIGIPALEKETKIVEEGYNIAYSLIVDARKRNHDLSIALGLALSLADYLEALEVLESKDSKIYIKEVRKLFNK